MAPMPAAIAPSGASPSGSAGGAAPSAAAVITIKNFAYQVPPSVRPGAMVKVTNSDQVAHTVTADQSDSVFNVTVDPGGNATFAAPSKPGSYKFHCTYHSNMHGTLVVK